jgi:hypothetical protein
LPCLATVAKASRPSSCVSFIVKSCLIRSEDYASFSSLSIPLILLFIQPPRRTT